MSHVTVTHSAWNASFNNDPQTLMANGQQTSILNVVKADSIVPARSFLCSRHRVRSRPSSGLLSRPIALGASNKLTSAPSDGIDFLSACFCHILIFLCIIWMDHMAIGIMYDRQKAKRRICQTQKRVKYKLLGDNDKIQLKKRQNR